MAVRHILYLTTYLLKYDNNMHCLLKLSGVITFPIYIDWLFLTKMNAIDRSVFCDYTYKFPVLQLSCKMF